jgi:MFS family permease
MPFVWSIGTIIGPAIGGLFANPSLSMPSVFPQSGLFTTFPYLLPNLICATLLLLSIVLGYWLLLETHPDMQVCAGPMSSPEAAAETPLLATSGALADSGVDLRSESYGTFNAVDIQEKESWLVNEDGSPRSDAASCRGSKVFCRRVLMVVIALGIFTYHSMSYDHLLPIFLQDGRNGSMTVMEASSWRVPGGLGLTIQAVGFIMSVNGLIALFVQAVVFPVFAAWLGVWKLFIVVTILHPIDYVMVPYLTFLPDNLLYPGIWVCLTVRNFTSILAYPLLLILLKEASPSPLVLGKINGLAASAAAACRTVAPPFAGYLYSLGAQQGFTGLAFWGSGVVAFVGAIQAFWIQREKTKTATVRSVAPCLAAGAADRSYDDVVRIEVAHVEV